MTSAPGRLYFSCVDDQQFIFVFCRKPSGHADKEVMAATVLTSLSTSPLVLYPSSAPTGNIAALCVI